MLSKLCWCFWQLFPCTYRTYYGDEAGRLHFTVWKMWFGRCYYIHDVIVDTFSTMLDDTCGCWKPCAPARDCPAAR